MDFTGGLKWINFINCNEAEQNKNNIFNVTDKEINDFVYNEDIWIT